MADSESEPPAKRAKPARPRNVLLAEFEGLSKEDASQALRDAGGETGVGPVVRRGDYDERRDASGEVCRRHS